MRLTPFDIYGITVMWYTVTRRKCLNVLSAYVTVEHLEILYTVMYEVRASRWKVLKYVFKNVYNDPCRY